MRWSFHTVVISTITVMAVFLIQAPLASAKTPHLWTVQAIQAGTEMSCDAFTNGMMGRPLYEFRFRRSKNFLLLIISYDGPQIKTDSKEASITIQLPQKGKVLQNAKLPAQFLKFGSRNAVVISLDPRSVDFRIFDVTATLTTIIDNDVFEIVLLATDHVRENMEACLDRIRK